MLFIVGINPSPMQMSMGTGELAYKLTLGKPDGGQVNTISKRKNWQELNTKIDTVCKVADGSCNLGKR
ncbi:hypothetical protein E0Y62_18275 [Cytobacillus praedii]|uniref:Uncharacterized protein n=1 Tax=Cytobacillus praedii TaxID=1742358 RepID=A0A4R1AY82_9BACI|nr:hypothetical protein E0Y62_18275 [Cytobacillus praedii]